MKRGSALRSIVPLSTEPECAHEWKKFKQTLVPQERTFQQLQMGLEWMGLGAYFILKACDKCKKKLYIDYKVER